MKHEIASLFCLLALTPFVAGPTVAKSSSRHGVVQELDVRDIVQHAKIPLREAIQRALAAHPGTAVEADLEGERTGAEVEVFFEVLLLDANGELTEVKISPSDGRVLAVSDAEDDESEAPEFAAAVRHSERSLELLAGAAEAFVKGVAVKASIKFESGSPIAEVRVANGRHLIDAQMEGRAGHLVGLSLVAEDLGAPRDHGNEPSAPRSEDADGEREHGH